VQTQKFRDYEKPLNAGAAFWSTVAGAARRPFRSLRNHQNYVSQLKDIPRYFAQQIVKM
jgi:uncharacterized protein (DUF885 family)